MTDVVVKPKKKPVRRKKPKKEDDEFAENAAKVKKLHEKFSKRKYTADNPHVKVKRWSEKQKVKNPETHDNTIMRAGENQMGKIYQVEMKTDIVQSAFKCALCQQGSGKGNLGDLFGPYYIKIGDEWPTFLMKKPSKSQNAHPLTDLWMHGDCVLWTPEVQMKGNQLVNLEEQVNKAWKQSCHFCHQLGASIPLPNHKFSHFPCAEKHNYEMNRTYFSCRPRL